MKRALLVLFTVVAIAVLFIGFTFGWATYYSMWRLVAGPRKRPLRNIVFARTEARRLRGQYLAEGHWRAFVAIPTGIGLRTVHPFRRAEKAMGMSSIRREYPT
ncbi:MAG: hypothetical protein JWQ87_3079 [Candidatus Sulfotelmatobacter sp.]|nr:hypothetical protein [Candidatus Sulfotelmatobacter sp.]